MKCASQRLGWLVRVPLATARGQGWKGPSFCGHTHLTSSRTLLRLVPIIPQNQIQSSDQCPNWMDGHMGLHGKGVLALCNAESSFSFITAAGPFTYPSVTLATRPDWAWMMATVGMIDAPHPGECFNPPATDESSPWQWRIPGKLAP